ncbi:unnamed protein product, partial [Allacma fusca]
AGETSARAKHLERSERQRRALEASFPCPPRELTESSVIWEGSLSTGELSYLLDTVSPSPRSGVAGSSG